MDLIYKKLKAYRERLIKEIIEDLERKEIVEERFENGIF